MNKKNSPYTAAITGGGFLFEETNILLPLLRATNSEELLHDEKVNNRLLGQTGKDVFRDYRKGRKTLFKVYGNRHLSV